jgi:hypothetical protein
MYFLVVNTLPTSNVEMTVSGAVMFSAPREWCGLFLSKFD